MSLNALHILYYLLHMIQTTCLTMAALVSLLPDNSKRPLLLFKFANYDQEAMNFYKLSDMGFEAVFVSLTTPFSDLNLMWKCMGVHRSDCKYVEVIKQVPPIDSKNSAQQRFLYFQCKNSVLYFSKSLLISILDICVQLFVLNLHLSFCN